MNKTIYTLVLLLAVLHSITGYSQPWFKDDPVKITLRKDTYTPGKRVYIRFTTSGIGKPVLPLSSLRFSDAVSDTSMRHRIQKLKNPGLDSIDIGIASVPGIYELLVEKINTRTLTSVTPAGRRLYGDSLVNWYNFFIYKDTSRYPRLYNVMEERQLPQLPASWAILDSFAKKIKIDSFNKVMDDSINHRADSVVICDKGPCPQYAVIINNGMDPFYHLNSVTIIADSSAVTDTAAIRFYIDRFAAILLDTTTKSLDTLTLGWQDKKGLMAELKRNQAQSTIIKTKGFVQEFMKTFAEVDIRYWSDKYYLAAINRKFFRQLIFVVKTTK